MTFLPVLRRMHRLGAVLSLVFLAACASSLPEPAPKPKLLVFLVVDGLPQRQVLAYRDQLAADGLARFLERGAWYADARYGHSFTVTGAGHATVLTGAYSHRNGIVGNEWRDQHSGAPEYCTGDTAHRYLDHATQPLDGTSPKNLKVETVGDMLRRADPRAKVIAVSGKDRGAILPAGKTGTAYMYMAQTGQFASSTWYMQQHPAWVNRFNGRKLADGYFKTQWKPVLDEAAYARSLPDNQPWYGPRGGALPMLMGSPHDDAPGPAFYSQLMRSPFGDAMTLEFARAAIEGEGLGQDEVPDILSISLSSHDYINHLYSAESRLSHDHLLQLDRLLQSFFAHLDATVGRDNYIAMLTADHGFMPAPEYSRSLGRDAGRINGSHVLGRLNAALAQRFGTGTGQGSWVSFSGSSLLVSRVLLAQTQADLNAVSEEARRLLLAEPGIAVAYTRRELEGGSAAGQPYFEMLRKSWHPQVSGDVQYAVKPFWMFGTTTATHGSPYEYDTHVPILAWGPRWVKPGRVETRVGVVDIAPTVAGWLGVAAPAANEGQPLPLPN